MNDIKLSILYFNRYLKEYHNTLQHVTEDQESFNNKYAGNPIQVFILIRRLVINWKDIERNIISDYLEGIEN